MIYGEAITKAEHDAMTRNMTRPLTWHHARWKGRNLPDHQATVKQTASSRDVVR